MKFKTSLLLIANVLVLMIGMGGYVYKHNHPPIVPKVQIIKEEFVTPLPDKIEPPIKNNISKATPSYLNYEQTIAQLKQWNQEAPKMTEIATYGKSSRGKDLFYLRICNKQSTADKPKVLITACIHGNEPLASSTVMWYIGTLLDKYDKDEEIRKLVDSRDFYFVPVVSPDSYPNSRTVDGVDPNRDFPGPSRPQHKSVAPVAALQDLFNKIKPKAVISGHTWGRVYLTPHGDNMQNCRDHDAIMVVMNKVKGLSGYRCIRACDMYGSNGGLNNPPIRTLGECECCSYGSAPIHGTEVDWYYRNGAFAIVCEFGSHQRIPSDADTKVEFDKTFKSFLCFCLEAPLVPLKIN